MSKKAPEETIRETLTQAGLYDARLEPAIENAGFAIRMRDKLKQDLSKSSNLLSVAGSMGQTKFMTNPLVGEIRAYVETVNKCLRSLGLNLDTSAASMKESGLGKKSSVEDFLRRLDE